LEKDLVLSLQKGKDDIAKLLIRKQRTQKTVYSQLRQQLRDLKEEGQQMGRHLEEQRLQFDALKVKASTFYLRQQQDSFDVAHTEMDDSGGCPRMDENEIELELLRRKEALQSGGEA